MRPLIAHIDRAALTHNLGVLRAAAGSAKVLAVIKANAYGHGTLNAAEALRAADGFAVLLLDEALALRHAGYSHPIVLLEGFFSGDELPAIAHARLRPVIHREDQIDLLEKAHLEHRLDVWLKLDTGMHRLGIPAQRARKAIERLNACAQVASVTLMTHFAAADEAAGVAAQQQVFSQCVGAISVGPASGGLKPAPHGSDMASSTVGPTSVGHNAPGGLKTAPHASVPVSLANSAALLRYPETHGDWVRPGIALYGASPFADTTGTAHGLKPVMTLSSRLIAIQPVKHGDGVGYGPGYIAERDMRVGIVACGYADGYPRHANTGTPILVDGIETRTLGRVSMDMLSVDLTPCPNAHIGSPVTLWGEGLPAERVAAAAGTIAYELFTAITPRVTLRVSSI